MEDARKERVGTYIDHSHGRAIMALLGREMNITMLASCGNDKGWLRLFLREDFSPRRAMVFKIIVSACRNGESPTQDFVHTVLQ